MKLLMHTCCAPCSVYCIETLKNELVYGEIPNAPVKRAVKNTDTEPVEKKSKKKKSASSEL